MGRVDKAWLEMDHATNQMIINGVMLFDEQLPFDAVGDVFLHRMVEQFPRFRQRVTETPPGSNRFYWEDDPHFDLRSHLVHIALPAPGDITTLQQLVSTLMSTSLDRNKPPWVVYLIDNVAGASALFARFHHAIADGIALIQVMLSMTDTDPDATLLPVVELPDAAAASKRGGWIGAGARFAARTTKQAVGLTESVVRGGIHVVRDPQGALAAAGEVGILTAASAAVLARLLLIPQDRKSVYRGELGTTKRVVWSEPVPLSQVKAIGRAAGGTVNDVLISALTGALRTDMLARGDDPDTGDLRAMVPVNLRKPGARLTLGNRFGLVYLSLPVSLSDPLQRLYEVKRRMDVLKQSPEAVVAYQVLNLLGYIPGEIAARGVELFAGKASAVLTNVPGPQQPLYFAGKPVRRIMFWVPQSGDIGLGISIISYNGHVTLGLAIDEKLCADPEPILGHFVHEFDVLTSLAEHLANYDDSGR